MPDHAQIEAGPLVHSPYRAIYANAAARIAETGFTAFDVNKVALQQDNNTQWIVTEVTSGAPTWAQIALESAMIFQGAWSNSVAYNPNDVVFSSAIAYICILAHTNHEPPNGTYWTSVGGGSGTGGTTRSVSSVSTATTAGAAAITDYVYFVSGTTTITLPTAVGNTNRYTISNVDTGVVTIATTSAQTIAGASTYTLASQYASTDFISDGSNWQTV